MSDSVTLDLGAQTLSEAAIEGGLPRRLKAGLDKITDRSFGYVDVTILDKTVAPNASGEGDKELFVKLVAESRGGHFSDRHVRVEGTVIFHMTVSGGLAMNPAWDILDLQLETITVVAGRPDSETTSFVLPPSLWEKGDEPLVMRGVNGAWNDAYSALAYAALLQMQRDWWTEAER